MYRSKDAVFSGFAFQSVFAHEALRSENQQKYEADAHHDNANRRKLVRIKYRDQVFYKAGTFEQHHHCGRTENHAGMGAPPAGNYRHECIGDDDIRKLRWINVLVIKRVEGAGEPDESAANGEDAYACPQHVLAQRRSYHVILAHGTHNATERRACNNI